MSGTSSRCNISFLVLLDIGFLYLFESQIRCAKFYDGCNIARSNSTLIEIGVAGMDESAISAQLDGALLTDEEMERYAANYGTATENSAA